MSSKMVDGSEERQYPEITSRKRFWDFKLDKIYRAALVGAALLGGLVIGHDRYMMDHNQSVIRKIVEEEVETRVGLSIQQLEKQSLRLERMADSLDRKYGEGESSFEGNVVGFLNAWNCYSSDFPPTTLDLESEVNLTEEDVLNILKSDEFSAQYSSDPGIEGPINLFQKFEYQLDPSVTSLNISWRGVGGVYDFSEWQNPNGHLFLWNHTESRWEEEVAHTNDFPQMISSDLDDLMDYLDPETKTLYVLVGTQNHSGLPYLSLETDSIVVNSE